MPGHAAAARAGRRTILSPKSSKAKWSRSCLRGNILLGRAAHHQADEHVSGHRSVQGATASRTFRGRSALGSGPQFVYSLGFIPTTPKMTVRSAIKATTPTHTPPAIRAVTDRSEGVGQSPTV